MSKENNKRAKAAQIRKEGFKELGKGLKQSVKNLKAGAKEAATGAALAAGSALTVNKVDDVISIVNIVKDMSVGLYNNVKNVVDITKAWGKIIFNDPSWYKYPGSKGDLSLNTVWNKSYHPIKYIPDIARVMVIDAQPTIGNREALNRNLSILYQKMRAMNTGAISYTMTDFANFVQYVRAGHAIHAEISRVLSVMNNFEAQDTQMPKLLVRELGFDYDAMITGQTELRLLMHQFSSFAKSNLHLDMKLFDRTRWLYGSIFIDDPNPVKAQKYVFKSDRGFTFNYHDDASGQYKQMTIMNTDARMTPTQVMTQVQNYMGIISKDNTYSVIAADLLRTFGLGNANAWDINWSDPHLPLVYTYDDNFLAQLHNAVFIKRNAYVIDADEALEGKVYRINFDLDQDVVKYTHPAYEEILDPGSLFPTENIEWTVNYSATGNHNATILLPGVGRFGAIAYTPNGSAYHAEADEETLFIDTAGTYPVQDGAYVIEASRWATPRRTLVSYLKAGELTEQWTTDAVEMIVSIRVVGEKISYLMPTEFKLEQSPSGNPIYVSFYDDTLSDTKALFQQFDCRPYVPTTTFTLSAPAQFIKVAKADTVLQGDVDKYGLISPEIAYLYDYYAIDAYYETSAVTELRRNEAAKLIK